MYELSYLISGAVAEANVTNVAQAVEKEIKKIKGEIINQVNPFKRKLSYPIKKQNFAYFVTLYFDAPKDSIKEVNQFFRFNENILRHLLLESTESAMKDYLRRQKSESTQENIQEEKVEVAEKITPIEVKQEEKPQEETPIEEPRIEEPQKEEVIEVAQTASTPEQTQVEIQEEIKKEKSRIEDIDKKIDEILNKTEI